MASAELVCVDNPVSAIFSADVLNLHVLVLHIGVKSLQLAELKKVRGKECEGLQHKVLLASYKNTASTDVRITDQVCLLFIFLVIASYIYTEQNYKRNTFVFALIFHELNSKI